MYSLHHKTIYQHRLLPEPPHPHGRYRCRQEHRSVEDHTRYEEPPQVPRRGCRAAIDREAGNIDGDGVDVVPNGSEQDQSADGAYC